MINDKSGNENGQAPRNAKADFLRVDAVKIPTRSLQRKIRVRKEDSAFVYFVLEANEGIAAYSTLEFKPGDPHRDLLLLIPPDFEEDVDRVLKSLGEMTYELERS